jgi:hypothetical protein
MTLVIVGLLGFWLGISIGLWAAYLYMKWIYEPSDSSKGAK